MGRRESARIRLYAEDTASAQESRSVRAVGPSRRSRGANEVQEVYAPLRRWGAWGLRLTASPVDQGVVYP